jgi:hypothetical protein
VNCVETTTPKAYMNSACACACVCVRACARVYDTMQKPLGRTLVTVRAESRFTPGRVPFYGAGPGTVLKGLGRCMAGNDDPHDTDHAQKWTGYLRGPIGSARRSCGQAKKSVEDVSGGEPKMGAWTKDVCIFIGGLLDNCDASRTCRLDAAPLVTRRKRCPERH